MKKFLVVATLTIALSSAWVLHRLYQPIPQLQVHLHQPPVPTINTTPQAFPYSVVMGGVHSSQEAQHATEDPVVKRHYANINKPKLIRTMFIENRPRYVSYRIGDKVFWTSKQVTIRAGEPILFDGKSYIRVRCGNRISLVPMQPVNKKEEPTEQELEMPPSIHPLTYNFELDTNLLLQRLVPQEAPITPPDTIPSIIPTPVYPPIYPVIHPPCCVPIIVPPTCCVRPPTSDTPEPSTFILLGSTLIVLTWKRKKI